MVSEPNSAGCSPLVARRSRLIYATATDGKAELRLLSGTAGRSFFIGRSFFAGTIWSSIGHQMAKKVAFSMFVKNWKTHFAKPNVTHPKVLTGIPAMKVIDDFDL